MSQSWSMYCDLSEHYGKPWKTPKMSWLINGNHDVLPKKTCHIAQHVVAMTGVDKSSEAKDHKDRMPEKIKFYPLGMERSNLQKDS